MGKNDDKTDTSEESCDDNAVEPAGTMAVDLGQMEGIVESGLPAMLPSQKINNLTIDHSSNVHVGNQIITSQLIIVNKDPEIRITSLNKDDNDSFDKEEKASESKVLDDIMLRGRTQFVLCMAYGVTIIVTIVLVLVWKFDLDIPDRNGTTTTSRPTASPIPPLNWFVNISQWTNYREVPYPDYPESVKETVAVSDTEDKQTCENVKECCLVLRDLLKRETSNKNINFNYLIGGDGRVYEVRGNKCPSDVRDDYSKIMIKIGFIGEYGGNYTVSQLQQDALEKLLNQLTNSNQLEDNYKMTPQCCRNIPRDDKTGSNVINFLLEKYPNRLKDVDKCGCIQEHTT